MSYERYTERARQVVVLAQDEARALKRNYIGTEHILLGFVREGEGVGARILLGYDADAEKIRNEIIRMLSGPKRGAKAIRPDSATALRRIGVFGETLGEKRGAGVTPRPSVELAADLFAAVALRVPTGARDHVLRLDVVPDLARVLVVMTIRAGKLGMERRNLQGFLLVAGFSWAAPVQRACSRPPCTTRMNAWPDVAPVGAGGRVFSVAALLVAGGGPGCNLGRLHPLSGVSGISDVSETTETAKGFQLESVTERDWWSQSGIAPTRDGSRARPEPAFGPTCAAQPGRWRNWQAPRPGWVLYEVYASVVVVRPPQGVGCDGCQAEMAEALRIAQEATA